MATVIFELLPLIVGATAVPLYPIVVLLFLLQDTGGLAKALSFVAGGIAMRLLQGLVFGLVLGAAVGASSEEGQRLGVFILLLIVGILLLITAFKKWQKEEDTDAPPPRWMAAISGMSAVRAVGAVHSTWRSPSSSGYLPCPQSDSSAKPGWTRARV